MNKQEKKAFMLYVGLCAGMRRIDEIVSYINEQMMKGREEINIATNYDAYLVLKKLEGTTDYKFNSKIGGYVTGLNNKEISAFEKEHYVEFMAELKHKFPMNWENVLRQDITTELREAEFKYTRTFWGKVKRIDVFSKGELSSCFDMNIVEGKACYGKCAKFEITPWLHFGLDSYSNHGVVTGTLHDTWFRYATSYYGQNGSVTKKDQAYHRELLAIGLTKIITETIHCQKL